MKYPKLKFVYNQTDSVDIIIHGGSKGIESSFLTQLFNASAEKGNSVLAFNFPYLDRGDESSSGEELVEEQEALGHLLEFIRDFKFNKIRFIAKSLGGIVLAKYIAKNAEKLSSLEIEVIVLGYVLGDIDLSKLKGKLIVIQGSKDRFGNANAVKKDLEKKQLINAHVIEIDGADHSYRVPETKEPRYEKDALAHIF